MNKSILLSLALIGVVGAIATGATISYFSDTETSTGNTFTAGAIDLTIDNESYVTNNEGVLVESPNTSWGLDDLTGQLFFDFSDLKPGDIGEDTISLHVNSNDAWACMSVAITGTPENNQSEPEAQVDSTTGDQDGELQNELYFAFWADDGDNVYEVGEEIFKEGLAGAIFDGTSWALADSQTNVWTKTSNTPLEGGINDLPVYHIGKVWCFGDLALTPVPQGENTSPLVRGTGFACDGAPITNVSQTDGITATVEFYAGQSRNNTGFTCASLNPQQPVRYTGNLLSFSSTGWGGHSCPTGMYAVGGGTIGDTQTIAAQGIAESGATIGGSTYPVFPHYTFPANETGYVVQNGAIGQTLTIYVDCLPI